MPAKIMLPTKAKMAALVWSGRSRPKLNQGGRLACQKASWIAATTPASIATRAKTHDAQTNCRATLSSYSTRMVSVVMALLLEGNQRQPLGVLVIALAHAVPEQQQGADDEHQANEDLQR